MKTEALTEQFVQALQGVAGQVVVADGPAAAVQAVVAALREYGVTEVVAWATPWLEQLGLPAAAGREGIRWLAAGPGVTADDLHAAAARAGAGITGADAAVAETGTLALMSGPGRPRCVSLLPPLHIAVVPADRVLPSIAALFRDLSALAAAGEVPSSLNLITGPSKTADIEHVLVRKVHGPGNLLVVLVRDGM